MKTPVEFRCVQSKSLVILFTMQREHRSQLVSYKKLNYSVVNRVSLVNLSLFKHKLLHKKNPCVSLLLQTEMIIPTCRLHFFLEAICSQPFVQRYHHQTQKTQVWHAVDTGTSIQDQGALLAVSW